MITVEDIHATLHELKKYGFTLLDLQCFCGQKYGADYWPIYRTFRYLMEN